MPAALLETAEVVVLAATAVLEAVMGQVGFGMSALLAIMATSPAHPGVAPEATAPGAAGPAVMHQLIKAGEAVVAPAYVTTVRRGVAVRAALGVAPAVVPVVLVCRLEAHHPAVRQIPHAPEAEVEAGPEKTYPGQTPEQVVQAVDSGVL